MQRRTQLIIGLGALGAGAGILHLLRRPRREHTRTELVTADRPSPVSAEIAGDDAQLTQDGAGPVLHRRYRIDIADAQMDAEQLMRMVSQRLPEFSPSTLADFDKRLGHERQLQLGDEFDISILGPWNGAVRVSEITPESFTFVTLEGHPEAGQIRFEALAHPLHSQLLRFQIQSWARSRDGLVNLAYNGIGIGREVQTNVWITFCERVAEASGGQLAGKVDVLTEEQPFTHEVIPNG